MNITLLKDNLAKGLSLVSRAASARSTLPVLNHILLAADGPRLRLSATNLTVAVTCWLDADVKADGGITVPAKTLADVVAAIASGDSVSLTLKEFEMTTTTRHTFGWVFGRWLVTLQLERIERATAFTPADDEDFIDWDVLAVQYGIPVNADGTGLQLCAECGQSVAPGSGRFVNRVPLKDFATHIQDDCPYPAGAYLCAECMKAIGMHNQQRQPQEYRTYLTRRSNR